MGAKRGPRILERDGVDRSDPRLQPGARVVWTGEGSKMIPGTVRHFARWSGSGHLRGQLVVWIQPDRPPGSGVAMAGPQRASRVLEEYELVED